MEMNMEMNTADKLKGDQLGPLQAFAWGCPRILLVVFRAFSKARKKGQHAVSYTTLQCPIQLKLKEMILMDKKTISIFGIVLLTGLVLAGCAGYYGGGYGYYDYPYSNYSYGSPSRQ